MHFFNLLTVTDCFLIEGRGLIITPDFSIPAGGWKRRKEEVTLVTPDGNKHQTQALFDSAHFNIRDPDVSLDRRWRVVIVLPEIEKSEVPIGSSIWVSEDLRAALFRQH